MSDIEKLKSNFFNWYMVFISSLGHSIFYTQAYKIFQLKSTYAVSYEGFILSFISIVSWLLYGLKNKIKPLIISNLIGLVGIVIFFIIYLLINNHS